MNHQRRVPGPDTFLLFYIKRRIEDDGRLKWHDAPYCWEEELPRGWEIVEDAALLFEADNRREIEEGMVQRLAARDNLNFGNFRKIVRHYLDLLRERADRSIAILALIAFTGMYARRLAELDIGQVDDGHGKWRDYRREIYQVSIYASRMLLTQLDGKWEAFCTDVAKLMEEEVATASDGSSHHQLPMPRRRTTTLAAGYPHLCGIGLPLMAVCGVGAAAYFWFRRCTA